jgi:hypothetical protein
MWEKREKEKERMEKSFEVEVDKDKRLIREFLSTNILDNEIRNVLYNVKEEKDLWKLYSLLMFREKLLSRIKENK